MSTSSKIEWTETTWNPIAGCTPVSAGCRNCYAANHARRLAGNPNPKVSKAYEGTARTAGDGRAVFTGRVNLMPERLEQPLRWKKPRRVFVNSMSDLFHEDVPAGFVAHVFAVMAAAAQHTFQILTKRPDRMKHMLARDNFWDDVWAHGMERWWDTDDLARIDEIGPEHPLPNVWLGTSTEDQAAADKRIPHLLRTPAAVRFLSCEPLWGPVELGPLHGSRRIGSWLGPVQCGAHYPDPCDCGTAQGIDWVIIGGESGPRARPCDVEWIRSLLRQCQEAGVPAFVKQLGARPQYQLKFRGGLGPGWWSYPEPLGLEDRKGGDPEEWPEDLRVREFPDTAGL